MYNPESVRPNIHQMNSQDSYVSMQYQGTTLPLRQPSISFLDTSQSPRNLQSSSNSVVPTDAAVNSPYQRSVLGRSDLSVEPHSPGGTSVVATDAAVNSPHKKTLTSKNNRNLGHSNSESSLLSRLYRALSCTSTAKEDVKASVRIEFP